MNMTTLTGTIPAYTPPAGTIGASGESSTYLLTQLPVNVTASTLIKITLAIQMTPGVGIQLKYAPNSTAAGTVICSAGEGSNASLGSFGFAMIDANALSGNSLYLVYNIGTTGVKSTQPANWTITLD
jgi:hypothetical protein